MEKHYDKKLEISHTCQILTNNCQIWFFLSYLITTVFYSLTIDIDKLTREITGTGIEYMSGVNDPSEKF